MKLNLTAVDSSQERILAYLQTNASESLSNKINNGTPFIKDNVQLINKKDLNGFMTYATEESRKLAKNGASYACIDDATVFGWAIHYFEEESIEGKLYNLDGTEYKPAATKTTIKQKNFVAPTTKVESPKPQQEQRSLFDILEPTTTDEPVTKQSFDTSQKELEPTTLEPLESKKSIDTTPAIEPVTEQSFDASQIEIKPTTTAEPVENKTVYTTPILEPTTEPTLDIANIDADTGEVLKTIPVTEPVEEFDTTQSVKQETTELEQEPPTFDRETMIYLATLLDDKIEIA